MANKRIKDLTSVSAPTAGDRLPLDGVTTRSITVENFKTSINGKVIVSFEGDSTSKPAPGNGTWTTYLLATDSKYIGAEVHHYAVDSQTADTMVADYATEAGAVAITDQDQAIFFIWGGINDILAGTSAAAIYADLQTLWAAARADGYIVVAFTIPPATGYTGPQETVRTTLNASIVGDTTLYDWVARPDSWFPDASNVTYYLDGLHLTATGNAALAQKVSELMAGQASHYRPVFTGAAAGESLALSSTLTSLTHHITSAASNAQAVGPNGATNPVWQIDGSTSSQAAGLKLTGAVAAGTVALAVISSGSNANLSIDAKGSGTITFGGTSTGAIVFSRAMSGTSLALSSSITSTAHHITSAAADALAVGRQGSTSPALVVDASTASSATGLKVKAAAAAGGLALSVVTSGTNENLTIDAAGSGTITIGATSTGGITLSRALTYGGVALSNAVTGTGNMVLSASPTLTGTLTFGTGTITALTEDTAPDPVADFLMTYDASATAIKKVKPANMSVGFSAHKNASNQTGIANNTFTKVTFTTELFDKGSYYDSTNSIWTPPAGLVQISASVYATSVTAANVNVISIYKNGVRFKDTIFQATASSDVAAPITIVDQANGTDTYEIYVNLITGATATANGAASLTYFMGKVL